MVTAFCVMTYESSWIITQKITKICHFYQELMKSGIAHEEGTEKRDAAVETQTGAEDEDGDQDELRLTVEISQA